MRKVLAVVGPTASGKTRISIELANKLNGEIISADSRQVYKHIPISTSQPSKEDVKHVNHHFINELEPDSEFNAGEFGLRAREIINEVFSKGKQPIIVGGSGLYIRSLIDGFFEKDIDSKEIRDDLYKKYELYGDKHLYDELKNIDEEIHSEIPPGKIRRVIRALEVYYATGKKISELQNENVKVNFRTVQTGLMYDRKILYRRINDRVDEMITNGLIEEVKWLKENNYDYRKNYSIDTVGIKEVYKYLESEYDYDEMISMIKQNTRRYAKRQMTWFRKDMRINWITIDEESDNTVIVNKVLDVFSNS